MIAWVVESAREVAFARAVPLDPGVKWPSTRALNKSPTPEKYPLILGKQIACTVDRACEFSILVVVAGLAAG